MNRERGRLVLVPSSLDLGTGCEVELDDVLPRTVLVRAAELRHWIVEDAKSARAFLKRVDRQVPLSHPLQALEMRELPRPPKGTRSTTPATLEPLLAPAMSGHDIGLLSEAGLPAVADPGASLVQAAHGLGIEVLPLAGPSSLMLALAASGLNGQCFAFVGYLPIEPAARAARIRELEQVSRRFAQTQLAIETPYRNGSLFGALVEHLQPATRLSVASGLTLPGGKCTTLPVRAWRERQLTFNDRIPTVFSWLAD